MSILCDSWTLTRRDLIRSFRWKKVVLFAFVSIAVLFMFGSLLDSIIRVPEGQSYMSFFSSGMVAFMAGILALNAGLDVAADKRGFMKLVLVAPVSRMAIVVGKMFTVALTSAAMFFLISTALMIYAKTLTVMRVFLFFLVLAAIVMIFVSLGVLLAINVETPKTIEIINSLLAMFFLFFSGIIYPLAALPWHVKVVAYASPMTYAGDVLAAVLTGKQALPLGLSVAVVVVLAVVLPFLSAYLFERKMRG